LVVATEPCGGCHTQAGQVESARILFKQNLYLSLESRLGSCGLCRRHRRSHAHDYRHCNGTCSRPPARWRPHGVHNTARPAGQRTAASIPLNNACRPCAASVDSATETRLRLTVTSNRVNRALRADHGVASKTPGKPHIEVFSLSASLASSDHGRAFESERAADPLHGAESTPSRAAILRTHSVRPGALRASRIRLPSRRLSEAGRAAFPRFWPAQGSADSFLNDGPLELGKNAHHLEHSLAAGVVVSRPC
jgi:hypothetical protein